MGLRLLEYENTCIAASCGMKFSHQVFVIFIQPSSNNLYYPMTHILRESEATITRCIWSHIPLLWFRAIPYGIYTMRQTHIPLGPLYICHIPLLLRGLSNIIWREERFWSIWNAHVHLSGDVGGADNYNKLWKCFRFIQNLRILHDFHIYLPIVTSRQYWSFWK